MKKKVLVIGVLSGILSLSFIFAATSQAQEEKVKSAKQQKIDEQKRAREEAEQAAKRAEVEKKIRQELRQLEEWTIYVIPSGPNPAKIPIKKDILTFSDISVTSQDLLEKEFRNSNYSLAANDDGTGVWETMQRNANGDIAFWKGQVKNLNMSGVLGLQPKKGPLQEFSFTTERPDGYVEPAPKKENNKANKGEVAKGKVVEGEDAAIQKIKD
jgi:hypothetical protein